MDYALRIWREANKANSTKSMDSSSISGIVDDLFVFGEIRCG